MANRKYLLMLLYAIYLKTQACEFITKQVDEEEFVDFWVQ